ncbi:MAG: hypothetical protein ACI4XL_13535 [Bacillus sp. (in: firmicutes)]
MTRQRRTFTPEFKLQLVKLYENGKSCAMFQKNMKSSECLLEQSINRSMPKKAQ